MPSELRRIQIPQVSGAPGGFPYGIEGCPRAFVVVFLCIMSCCGCIQDDGSGSRLRSGWDVGDSLR
jgi:hypothetical protein